MYLIFISRITSEARGDRVSNDFLKDVCCSIPPGCPKKPALVVPLSFFVMCQSLSVGFNFFKI